MGGKQPSTVTQTNEIKLSPEQQEVFGMALPKIKEYAASNPQLFSGSGIVGFNDLETQGQEGMINAANAAGANAGKANAAQGMMLDPEQMLNPNQYVDRAAEGVTRGVTKNLMETILPGIRSSATSAGGQYSGGSTRQGIAEGRAIEGTNKELADSVAKMYLSNYQQGLGVMQNAVGMNGKVMQEQLFPSQVLQAVGGQKRGMEQAKLDEEIQKFYTQQDLPLLQSQQIMGLLSGMPGGQGVSTVTPATPKTDPMQQAIGLGLTLAGSAMGLPMPMMMGK